MCNKTMTNNAKEVSFLILISLLLILETTCAFVPLYHRRHRHRHHHHRYKQQRSNHHTNGVCLQGESTGAATTAAATESHESNNSKSSSSTTSTTSTTTTTTTTPHGVPTTGSWFEPTGKAYPQQTPHSGRHFIPSHPAYDRQQQQPSSSWWWWQRSWHFIQRQRRHRQQQRRFTEGWYYRLTIPNDQNDNDNENNHDKNHSDNTTSTISPATSFAFIISIEDPGRHVPAAVRGISRRRRQQRRPSELRLACIQVIGPNDEYLVQASQDDSKFWAWQHQQGLGCTFEYKKNKKNKNNENENNNNNIGDNDDDDDDNGAIIKDINVMTTCMSKPDFMDRVESGFQILPNTLWGRIRGRDGTALGSILDDHGIPFSCDFDITITPICGWGGQGPDEQRSTAGWLASFPIFEPHWQITMADARATGSVMWKNKTFTFQDVPFYAEKNWGAALPKKWYWTQCNSFQGYNSTQQPLSVVAGGGIRKIPFGKEEALGMVTCHYNGTMYEAVPWMGGMSWKVDTWGKWILKGNSTRGEKPFEIEVIYECDPLQTPGLVFRAPTPDEGMVRFCRDTFEANCTLSLWELEWNKHTKQYERAPGPPLIDRATSHQGGAEVGGGPWWDTWEGEAKVKRPIAFLLRLPYRLGRIKRRLRKPWTKSIVF